MGGVLKVVKKVALPAIGFALGGPLGAAVGGAAGSALRGGNIGQIIQGGLYGYGGANLASGLGTAVSSLNSGSTIGQALLGQAARTLPSGVSGPVTPATQGLIGAGGSLGGGSLLGGSTGLMNGGTNILQAVGGLAGISGQGGGQPQGPRPTPAPAPQTTPAISRPSPMAAPRSLSALAGFDPMQERSYLATSGVNSGLDSEQDSYYRNLVQRSLIGDDNKPTDSLNSLLPIESEYFSGKGIDTSSIDNFLRQIRGY